MSNLYQDHIDYQALEIVACDFFAPYENVVSIDTKKEGNWIRDGKFSMGCWAGPNADIDNLLHEMAHMVEIDDRRCMKPDWGFKYGNKVMIGGREYDEGMFTTKAIEREIRVFGIQTVLKQHYAISGAGEETLFTDPENGIYKYANLCRFIDGFSLYKPKNSEGMDYKETEEYAKDRIAELIEAETYKWSFDEILREWDRKMLILDTAKVRSHWSRYH